MSKNDDETKAKIADWKAELDKIFEDSEQERERYYEPRWKAQGAYEILSHDIKRTERYDRQWEEFLLSCPYWSSWRENLASFRKVSDLKYYCLRVSEIIQYKDKVSDYGSKRDKETFEKVDKFAWRLMKMNREEFHKEFGGYYDEKIENYRISSDGRFWNILFPEDVIEEDEEVLSCTITELEDEEEAIQNNATIQNDELFPAQNKNDKEGSANFVKSQAKRNAVDNLIENFNNQNQRERNNNKNSSSPKSSLEQLIILVKKSLQNKQPNPTVLTKLTEFKKSNSALYQSLNKGNKVDKLIADLQRLEKNQSNYHSHSSPNNSQNDKRLDLVVKGVILLTLILIIMIWKRRIRLLKRKKLSF